MAELTEREQRHNAGVADVEGLVTLESDDAFGGPPASPLLPRSRGEKATGP
ncbi:hypothetical protein P3H80_29210 [Mycolicibacterium septicum]|uniref:hypothetical protein n=1 Tax=Mycolicibacterium septicum TaxID=98668 RepID=UPI0023E2148D|nr:hypothetical protein [Mycolicibacterium septicum]MDF3341532.1 hypothetical protein [Mycolicibacterium septicum]